MTSMAIALRGGGSTYTMQIFIFNADLLMPFMLCYRSKICGGMVGGGLHTQ
jgi:hypothetical protein